MDFEFILLNASFQMSWNRIMRKHGVKWMFFEAEDMTVERLEKFKKMSPAVEFRATIHEVASQKRVIKDEKEIWLITKAQRIIEQVFYIVKKELKVGQTEKEIAWRIKELCQHFGADDVSFEPIVGFAENSASPHHQNTERKLKKGDVVLIDHGARYKGYCSDMTRMIFTAKPSEHEARIYNIVLKAQTEAIKQIRPGARAAHIDRVARSYIEKKGHGPQFTHSLGHGVGIEVHDAPINLSASSTDLLQEHMVVTIEPGIYLPKKVAGKKASANGHRGTGKRSCRALGVRIEDIGVVTKTGINILTNTPKTLKSCIKLL